MYIERSENAYKPLYDYYEKFKHTYTCMMTTCGASFAQVRRGRTRFTYTKRYNINCLLIKLKFNYN